MREGASLCRIVRNGEDRKGRGTTDMTRLNSSAAFAALEGELVRAGSNVPR